jgi:hypothetical protein
METCFDLSLYNSTVSCQSHKIFILEFPPYNEDIGPTTSFIIEVR